MKAFDIFGSQVLLRYQGMQVHKTKVGAIATIALVAILGVRLIMLISQAIEGHNPIVLFQERQVDNPRKFIIKPSTYAIAIGIQDKDYNYVQDDTIFSVIGVQEEKVSVLNTITGKKEDVWNSTEFPLQQCVEENIADEYSRQYFVKSDLSKHYCFPINKELHIEGEFHSDTYSAVKIILKRCSGTNCASNEVINQLLDNHFVEALFTDAHVLPEQKAYPFKHFSRDIYWTSSQNLPRESNLYLRNNYVESNIGWFQDNIITHVFPCYSYPELNIVDKSADFVFSLVIRFEKQKENLTKRQYKSMIDIMSEFGGFSQIFVTLFFFFGSMYSQMNLNKSLINETFNFQEVPLDEVELKDRSSGSVCQNSIPNITNNMSNSGTNAIGCQDDIILEDQTKPIKMSSISGSVGEICLSLPQSPYCTRFTQEEEAKAQFFSKKQNNAGKEIESSVQSSPSQSPMLSSTSNNRLISSLFRKLDVSSKLKRSKYQKQDTSKSNQLDNSTVIQTKVIKENESRFKEVMSQTTHRLRINIFEYLASFVCKIGRLKQQKKVIDYSIEKLYQWLDVQQLIHRLIEVDKLKRIFLDDDQIQLLEFLPKSTINYSFDSSNTVHIQDKKDMFSQDTRPHQEKVNAAIQSYQNIANKPKLSKIDEKIIKFIDPKFNAIFKEAPNNNRAVQMLRNVFAFTSAISKEPDFNVEEHELFQQDSTQIDDFIRAHSSQKHVHKTDQLFSLEQTLQDNHTTC